MGHVALAVVSFSCPLFFSAGTLGFSRREEALLLIVSGPQGPRWLMLGVQDPHHDEDPEVSSLPRRKGWLSFADVIKTCHVYHTVPTATGLFNGKPQSLELGLVFQGVMIKIT